MPPIKKAVTKSWRDFLKESVLDSHEKVEEQDEEELPPVEEEEKECEESEEELPPVEEEDEEDEEEKKEPVEEEDEEDEKPSESDEEEDDDLKEFDVNDDSDVFIDDGDEPVEEEDEEEEKEDEEQEEKDKAASSLDMEESVAALVYGENLSDDFKKKAKIIFESAVKERVIKHSKRLKEAYNHKLRNAKKKMASVAIAEMENYINTEIVESIDTYLTHIAEEWLKQNKLAVEHGIRTELTEEFMKDLRILFESHNIMIPDGAENIVESQVKKINKLESELASQFRRTVLLEKKLNEQLKNDVFKTVCEGLADTQIERLKQLALKIEFNPETYKEELSILKESYFPTSKKVMDKQISIEESKKDNNVVEPEVNNRMIEYKRLLKNF